MLFNDFVEAIYGSGNPKLKIAPLFFGRQSGASDARPVGFSNAHIFLPDKVRTPGDEDKLLNHIRIFNRFIEVLAFEERKRTSAALARSFMHMHAVPDCGSVQLRRAAVAHAPRTAEHHAVKKKYSEPALKRIRISLSSPLL